MTQNTQDPSMQKPIIEGQGGEDEATQEVTTNPEGEDTPDQETTTDDSLEEELDRLEKERKKLARTNARQGERTKEARLAALDAVAQLDAEKATDFLEKYPEYKDDFEEKYPDFFDKTPPKQPEEVKSKKPESFTKAELFADLERAGREREQHELSVRFAVENKLTKEEHTRLKKVASAIVSADPSTSFDEALSSAYVAKYGKSPEGGVTIPRSSGDKPKGYSQAQLDWWSKNVGTNIQGDTAVKVQKGADEFYNSATIGGGQQK